MDHISTFSGQRINLQAKSEDELIVEIKLSDIALGLSRTARFNGQTTEFYSVAQHSCLVADSVPSRLRLAALLHDAAEYATGDIVSPLKAFFPEFKLIEHRIEKAIFSKFGIVSSDYDKKIIKSAARWPASAHDQYRVRRSARDQSCVWTSPAARRHQ